MQIKMISACNLNLPAKEMQLPASGCSVQQLGAESGRMVQEFANECIGVAHVNTSGNRAMKTEYPAEPARMRWSLCADFGDQFRWTLHSSYPRTDFSYPTPIYCRNSSKIASGYTTLGGLYGMADSLVALSPLSPYPCI